MKVRIMHPLQEGCIQRRGGTLGSPPDQSLSLPLSKFPLKLRGSTGPYIYYVCGTLLLVNADCRGNSSNYLLCVCDHSIVLSSNIAWGKISMPLLYNRNCGIINIYFV